MSVEEYGRDTYQLRESGLALPVSDITSYEKEDDKVFYDPVLYLTKEGRAYLDHIYGEQTEPDVLAGCLYFYFSPDA